MKKTLPITALFVDIGGVLLTNEWDHQARKRAAKMFGLDMDEMEDRHHVGDSELEMDGIESR